MLTFTFQADLGGSFRIDIANQSILEYGDASSGWTNKHDVARIKIGDRQFVAVSKHFTGNLPAGVVFEIIEHPTVPFNTTHSKKKSSK